MDAGVDFVHLSRALDGIVDVGRLGQRGPVDGRVLVLVHVDGRGWLGVVMFEVPGDASQGFCGAEERVVVGTVADALAFDSALLSDELWSRGAQVGKLVIVQGRFGGIAHRASNVKVNVLEFEGLRASIGGASAAAFGRLKQPEESHDDEVNDVSVKSSIDGVLGVDDVIEGAEDGHIDRAGAGRRDGGSSSSRGLERKSVCREWSWPVRKSKRGSG